MRFATIRSLLTDAHGPAFIQPSATATEAVRLMHSRKAPALVVQQAPSLGVISNSEIVDGVVARHRDPDATPVSELVETLDCVDASTSLDRVWSAMNERGLGYLAIRDADRVIAIVSRPQIMQLILRSQEEEVDCAMSAVKRFTVANRRPV